MSEKSYGRSGITKVVEEKDEKGRPVQLYKFTLYSSSTEPNKHTSSACSLNCNKYWDYTTGTMKWDQADPMRPPPSWYFQTIPDKITMRKKFLDGNFETYVKIKPPTMSEKERDELEMTDEEYKAEVEASKIWYFVKVKLNKKWNEKDYGSFHNHIIDQINTVVAEAKAAEAGEGAAEAREGAAAATKEGGRRRRRKSRKKRKSKRKSRRKSKRKSKRKRKTKKRRKRR